MTSDLVFWSGDFSYRMRDWLKLEFPLFLQEWDQAIEEENQYTIRSGHKPFNHGTLIDRAGEDEFTFHSKTCVDWVPFQE